MSATQSPVCDRTSSTLNRDLPPDKKPKGDTPTLTPAREFDSTGLVQRCVIIQRDENGFGLTVSGDNPVFVQLVKEDGAAMRAGVQAGDRIIKVNGTLVTQSNHGEVVKLIRSGSYVALTVLGRPPGSPQVPLSEVDMNLGSVEGHGSSLVTPPRVPRADDWEYKSRTEAWENSADAPQTILVQEWQDLQEVKEDSRHVPRDEQDAPLQQNRLRRAARDGVRVGASEAHGAADATRITTETFWSSVQRASGPGSPDDLNQRDSTSLRMSNLNSGPSPKTEDTAPLTSHRDPGTGNTPAAPIIAADNDCFDSEQEQTNGQCSCFQSVELLKCRPAHLAAFLHHVVSQCDPAPVVRTLLCYLHTELYKHANPKEGRRVFMDFLSFYVDHGANLKVAVPESISSDLECRRPELIPEDLHRQYIQTMQDTLLPDVQRVLEDFRQKHSMGLSVADDDLSQLDGGGDGHTHSRDQERACAESILSKIVDVLTPLQATDEDRCMTAQYVILSYMKFLGVRNREAKRTRINFLPKIKKIKMEKDGEEKVKKPRFSILGPPRRPSRPDAPSAGRVVDASKLRHQKPLPQSLGCGSEGVDSGRVRSPQLSEGSDPALSPAFIPSPGGSATYSPGADTAVRDPDCGGSRSPSVQRPSDGGPTGDVMEYPPCDYLLYSLDHLDEERDMDRLDEVLSEDDGGGGGGGALYSDADPPNWQQLVGREVLAGLTPHEIKRQEVINELFYTERAHMRMLKVLDTVFYQKLARDNILPSTDIRNIFANLEEIVHLHVTISEQMVAIRRRNELFVVDQIGDSLLSWFGGAEEERMKRAVGAFCSNQPFALELIKHRQKKDQRFLTFMQEAESNRLCRRLQLKDIIPAEMQRLTKYPLLLENMAKYTDDITEKDKVKRAADCCRKILNHVNQAVKEAENKQRLEVYQRRLDLSSLKQSENPLISELKNLDLTKRKLVHEGPLTWKLNKDKTLELYTLLLEDVLVLLQKQDDRLILKCHSKNRAGTADSQHTFSPVVKLNTVLVRSVATDNRSFFVLSMSDNGAQIYELMAQTVSEQRLWQRHISQCAEMMKATPHSLIALPQGSGEKEGVSSASGKGSTGLSPVSRCSSGPAPSPAPSPKEVERAHKVGQDYGSSCLDTDLLNSECRAEEALKTLAVLKQVLVTQLMAQDSDDQFPRPASGRLLRTSSLRSPVQHGSEHSPCRTRDTTAGDTGFYEGPEDCGYLVLEGCGESSTDDGVRCGRRTLGLAHSCAADSGISLRFPSASAQSVGLFSRQVLAHLRDLQADLNHLKGVESRYHNLVRQRHAENGDSKDKN